MILNAHIVIAFDGMAVQAMTVANACAANAAAAA
jgi:hypothetical protein